MAEPQELNTINQLIFENTKSLITDIKKMTNDTNDEPPHEQQIVFNVVKFLLNLSHTHFPEATEDFINHIHSCQNNNIEN